LGNFSLSSFAQTDIQSNGLNLESVCSDESCTYINWEKRIYFPTQEEAQWFIDNLEFAIKKNGNYLITGDLYIYGQDSAAIISLNFIFIDASDQDVYMHKTGQFEFFNEPANAEPIVFSGVMPPEAATSINYLNIRFEHSEIIAYYNIHSSCFLPCKNNKLKEAMKAFKKSK